MNSRKNDIVLICLIIIGVIICILFARGDREVVSIGTGPNDATGDSPLEAFDKVNTNFFQLFDRSFTNFLSVDELADLPTLSTNVPNGLVYVGEDGFEGWFKLQTIATTNMVSVANSVDSAIGWVRQIPTSDVMATWFGAVKDNDGTIDNWDAIQSGILYVEGNSLDLVLPPGTNLISKTLTNSLGKFTIKGNAQRHSIIYANSAINMLSISRSDASFYGSVQLKNFRIDGADVATNGLETIGINYSHFENLEIFHIDGNGWLAANMEDCSVENVAILHTGNWANTIPSLWWNFDITPVNSISVVGMNIERPRYPARFDAISAVKFVNLKAHGRLTSDDASPNEVDLLRFVGGDRISLIAPQIAHPRRYGIRLDSFNDDKGVTIVGGSFSSAANYQGGTPVYVRAETGTHVVTDCIFNPINSPHTSYTTSGIDIQILAGCMGVSGQNLHLAVPNQYVEDSANRLQPDVLYYDASDVVLRYPTRNLRASGTDTSFIWNMFPGESQPRSSMTERSIRFGDGTSNDTVLFRAAANRLDMGTGDTFRVEGVWNGGMLRIGNGYLWQNGTNIYVKGSAPAGATDGISLNP